MTAEGVKTYTCAVCSATRTEAIPKLNKPTTPTNVKAAASATGTITVSWKQAAGATTYYIYRYKGDTKKYEYIGASTGTSYKATGLSAGTAYYFKVLSVNKSDGTPYYSAYSEAVTATAKEYLSAANLTLSAQKFAYDGKSHMPTLTVKNAAGKTLTVGTDYTVTYPAGMTTIGTYTFRVTGAGNYAGTASKSFTVVPTTVTGVSAAPSASGKIKVSWKAASGAQTYYVYRYKGDTKKYEYIGASTGTGYTASGLTGGTTYYFKVLALAKVGDTPYYAAAYSATVNTKCLANPAAPTNVKAAASAANTITVSWSASANATQYNVYRYNGTKKAYVYLGTSKTASYQATGLANGTTYYFKVVPVTKAGGLTLVGPYSAAVSAKCVGAPAAPTGLTGKANAAGTITLSWKAVNTAVKYKVYRYNGTEKKYQEIGSTTSCTYAATGLSAGTTYYFKVAAVTSGSGMTFTSAQSEAVSVKCVNTPKTPDGLKAVASAPNTVTLSWNKSDIATQYNVYRYNGTKKEYVYVGTSKTTSYSAENLSSGVTYYFKVMAVYKTSSVTRTSELSASVSCKAVGVPAVPKNVTATPTSGGANLTWSAVTGATQYNIYRSAKADGSYTYIGTANAAKYSATGLTSGTTYYFKVTAVIKGNGMTFVSDYSAAVSAKAK